MSAVSNVGSFILTICYLALATQTVQPMPYDPFTNIKYFSGNIKQQITGSSSNNANGGGGGNKDNYNDSYLSSYCDYDVDIFSCLNLNCNGIRLIRKFPKALKDITTYQLKPNQFLCSVDLSDTGIVELSATNTFEHFSFFYSNLLKFNPNQTTIKLSFSNIEYIRELKFPVELNLVLFVRDSNVRHVQPKSLSGSNKLELNFINVNMTIPNWFNLLESSRLKLLNLRNIQNLKEEYTAGVNKDVMFNPTTNIIDVKIHYSYLPVLDDHFIFFKLLKSIEQLEIIRCSIAFIKNTIFDKYSNTFRYLKYLALSNNNINRITDQTFNGLNNLITLDLDENPIEFIHPQTFTSLKKLRFLSMSSNTYSLNVKSLTKTTNPVWLFNMFKNNRELKEIHYKTSRLLNNYCILNSIVMNVKSFNENINGLKNNTLSLNHLINDALSSNGEFIFNPYADNYKKLRMFSPDQLEMRYETFIERSNLEILCSAYMVCKYTKVYDNNDNTDLWVIESFRVCPAIINKNMDSRCGLVQKNTECQNLLAEVKNKNPSQLSANRTTLYAETPGITGIKTLMNNIKANYFKTSTSIGYIVTGILIFLLVILVLSCLFYTCRKRKEAASSDYIVSQNPPPQQYSHNSPLQYCQNPPQQYRQRAISTYGNQYYTALPNKDIRGRRKEQSNRCNNRSKSIY